MQANEKTESMTYKEEVTQIIAKANSPKAIFNILDWTSVGMDSNNRGFELAKMIVENSNDFTKDIAQKWIISYGGDSLNDEDSNGNQNMEILESLLSDKQIWCLSYQVMNNKNVYLN